MATHKPTFGLLMPPPNLTGEPHMGHAMQHAILDAIARFKRMRGFNVLLLPGVDHAGIQFESTFNKKLEKEGLNKQILGREKWLLRAWEFKEEVYKSFHSTWSIFGISADWSKEVFTLEKKVQEAVLEEFKRFFDDDLLYKGAYIVQWCPKDITAIEDIEMEYEERREKLYFIKYEVPSSNEFITIATARPETISADVAIAVYPKHPKYDKLIGLKAKNPFTSSLIPIIEDKRVKKGFGTGALKITPGHDLLDFEIGKTHNLPLLHVVSKEGRITDLDPNLTGLKVPDARKKSVDILEGKGAIEKTEDYSHFVPVCERCKTTIEPLISEELFVKMEPIAKKSIKKIDDINFFPKNYLKIISKWIKNVHDWCISRPLWWGYRIPIWYCDKCNSIHEIGKNKDMVISFDIPAKICNTCKEKHWVQEEKVLDTWFSSGIWPMATLGWPNQTEDLKKYYPWDFELSGHEIKYLWIARMIMLGIWFTDQIPFKNMFFHGMLRDLQGRKFSKSLGNGIDPKELINQWGTDPVRMTLYSYSAPGRDAKASKNTMDQRCKNYRNFATKLRNITRFIIDLAPENLDQQNYTQSQIQHPDDKKISEKLNRTIKEVTKKIETYHLHLATEIIYNFIWHEFADKYIESTKKRRAQAQATLEYIFRDSLLLIYPFMPFMASELWEKIKKSPKESIDGVSWPNIKPKPN